LPGEMRVLSEGLVARTPADLVGHVAPEGAAGQALGGAPLNGLPVVPHDRRHLRREQVNAGRQKILDLRAMLQVVIYSHQGVGLAAAEGGLDLDHGRSLALGQLGVDPLEEVLQPRSQIGLLVEEVGIAVVVGRGLGGHVAQVGGEDSLVEVPLPDVRVRRDDVVPVLHATSLGSLSIIRRLHRLHRLCPA
jgi:hypothetical protein